MVTIDLYWIARTVLIILGGLCVVWASFYSGQTIVKSGNSNLALEIVEGSSTKRRVILIIVIGSFVTSLLIGFVSGVATGFLRGINICIVAFIISFPTMIYAAFQKLSVLVRDIRNKIKN